MHITELKPGTYVVAVSGGVDSMALLHYLHSQNMSSNTPARKLIVAHLDHGIREDSIEDRRLVQKAAHDYALPFVYHEANLGAGASEAEARRARYDFLEIVRRRSQASSIITAHHHDDVLETAIINILRGSGRKGLTSLQSRLTLERPLLHIPKQQLITYAREQGLVWREDSTNQDTRYLRNHVRHQVLATFDDQSRKRLGKIISDVRVTNNELDNLLGEQLKQHMVEKRLDRQWFTLLPHIVAREIMASWLRTKSIRNFDSRQLERLVVAAKVAQPGSQFDVMNGTKMTVWVDNLALARSER